MTPKGTILLGTNIGLYEYDPTVKAISDLKLDSVKVLEILITTDNSLWVYTEDQSQRQMLFHHNKSGWTIHLENQVVNTIFESSDNTIWVGSHQGLYHFDGSDWFKPISDKINCISQLKDGTITVGADNGFWIRQNKETVELVIEQPGIRFMGLGRTSDGLIWGRSSLGILSYDGISWTNHGKEKSTYLGSGFQAGIFEASDGTFWFNGFISVIKMVFGKLTKFVPLQWVLPKQVMGKFGPMEMVGPIGMIEAEASVFCGAVLGASRRMSCVLLAAASALLVGTAAAAFAVCQDRLNYPWPHEVRSLQATKERPLPLVSQRQTRLASVAEPIETASRLIAVVQLDNGFPLMLGVATPKVARSRGDSHDGVVGWLE